MNPERLPVPSHTNHHPLGYTETGLCHSELAGWGRAVWLWWRGISAYATPPYLYFPAGHTNARAEALEA